MWDYLLLFCLLHNHHSIPHIVLCPWLTLMYCVKVEKVWQHQKHETIAWLVIGVVNDLNILCDEDGATSILYDFVGITFFRHDCLVSMLEVLLFIMSIWTFILYHLDLNIHATIKKITLRIMLGSIPHQFLFLSFTYSRESRN